MTARTTAKNKATVVNDIPFVDKPQAVPEATLFEELTAQIPDDWRRRTVAAVAGLATSLGVGYIVAAITEYAIVGALTLTGSAFMALLILLLGLIMTMYIGSKSSIFVYTNIVNKNIDRAYSAADATVRGWFTPTQGATA